jgi:hypothetical protein
MHALLDGASAPIAHGYSDGDVDTNASTTIHLNALVDARYSRRQALGGGVSSLAAAAFGSTLLAGCGEDGAAVGVASDAVRVAGEARAAAATELGFAAVTKNLLDVVTVPEGYTATVLYRLGDPILPGVAGFANDGTDTNYAGRAGDHHDGMSFFGLNAATGQPDANSSTAGMLVMNHENISQSYLHPNGATPGTRPEGEALKEIECHGVSVVQVARENGAWAYRPLSPLNRRVTPNTAMEFRGPVRGNPALRTLYSPDGTTGRGTINNCASGTMPWNTYLTCEENWAGYFRRDASDAAARAATGAAGTRQNQTLARYGGGTRAGNYGWATVQPADAADTRFRRWNITVDPAAPADGTGDFRNEVFQYGWVVEIDPFDPAAAPRKRTALGRMNHEGCVSGRMVPGVRPAFYMGDDAQNEYIYKFVSDVRWSAADASSRNRLAVGDKYLDRGTLFVARFDADGTGRWLPLVFGQGPLTPGNAAYSFQDQADVLINTRLAADALGATPMDRPEWTAVNPANGEMYCTLTNNSSRTAARTDAANPRAYSDPKRTGGQTNGNANGHIVRLRETGDTTEAVSFTWDVYLFGAGADLDPQNINLSGLTDANDLSSPDGLWFSQPTNAAGRGTPVMWIETDDGAYTDVTNCMLLAAVPGRVGDGGPRDVTATVGAAPGTNVRRFLVGPKECEITGITSTPDGTALFVNVQHPGEDGRPSNITSNWPQSQPTATGPGTLSGRPRSATVVVTRNDGGVVGL